MDALAAEGAVFDRAYCTTPLCAPSRASMMTGRMPSDIDTFDNGDDFAASLPTFAHHLRAAPGYHTALIGRMHFIGPDQHHGFEQRLTTDVYPADMDMVPDWRRELGDRMQWYHDADAVYELRSLQATVQQDFERGPSRACATSTTGCGRTRRKGRTSPSSWSPASSIPTIRTSRRRSTGTASRTSTSPPPHIPRCRTPRRIPTATGCGR